MRGVGVVLRLGDPRQSACGVRGVSMGAKGAPLRPNLAIEDARNAILIQMS